MNAYYRQKDKSSLSIRTSKKTQVTIKGREESIRVFSSTPSGLGNPVHAEHLFVDLDGEIRVGKYQTDERIFM